MDNKIKLLQLLPFITEAFERNQSFKIPVTGTSMNPLLFEKRDYVLIEKPSFPLSIGDIPLYRRKDGSFVLHRIVGVNETGYIMCGDNQFMLEYGITDGDIIGVTTQMSIDGKTVSVNDGDYIKHKEKYIRNIKTRYPARRLRYNLSVLLKGKNNG